jgi:hypothetical protein
MCGKNQTWQSQLYWAQQTSQHLANNTKKNLLQGLAGGCPEDTKRSWPALCGHKKAPDKGDHATAGEMIRPVAGRLAMMHHTPQGMGLKGEGI